MGKSKSDIANGVMDEFKKKYLVHNNLKESPRVASIIGATEIDGENICKFTSKLLQQNGIAVKEFDIKEDIHHDATCHPSARNIVKSSADSDILMLGHGDMRLKWFEDHTDAEIDYLLDVNLASHMKIIKDWIRQTIDKQYKKYIVIIGSMAYDNVLNGSVPYMVAKAGLSMLVKGLAWELAPKNYNVIGIHPSNTIDTPMTRQTINEIMKFRNVDWETAESYWGAVLPKDKFLTKDQLAEFINFFVSGKCDYLSGANIEFRGGQR